MLQASSASQGLGNGEAWMTCYPARENSLAFQNLVFLGTEGYIFQQGIRYDLAVSPAVTPLNFMFVMEIFTISLRVLFLFYFPSHTEGSKHLKSKGVLLLFF